MKGFVRVVSVAMILAMVLGTLGAGVAMASARSANWTVSVTYENVSANPATIVVDFYQQDNGTPVFSFNPLGGTTQLPAGASASFAMGSVSGVPGTFRGSAVMSSDQPLVATVVQYSTDAGFHDRLLSNGFQAGDASNQFLVPTVLLNKFNETTVFSIQNTETQDVKATVRLVDASNGSVAATKDWVIPGGSSKYIEMDNATLTGLAAGVTTFNGSAIITAVMNSDGTTPAKIVASASELYTNKNIGANFEGVPLGRAANTLYMATALCNSFQMNTNYAVQNASLNASASVSVTYYNANGTAAGTDGPYPIAAGQKRSFAACTATSNAALSGSAVITSSGAPIVAIGKAGGNGAAATSDIFTAFMGENQGYAKVALPFVRYATDADYNNPSNVGGAQRANIAVQNLTNAEIKVKVSYFGKAGGTAAGSEVLTIAPKAKANSNAVSANALGKQGMKAGAFGYYTDGTFGGGVIIEPDASTPNARFIAVARLANPGAAEDYNAMPVQVPAQ